MRKSRQRSEEDEGYGEPNMSINRIYMKGGESQ